MIEKQVLRLPCMLYDKKATVYTDPAVPVRAAVLYFHGGGLLYGSREDLPEGHLTAMTREGFAVIAFDYPLAPAARLPEIMDDVYSSIESFIAVPEYFIPDHGSSCRHETIKCAEAPGMGHGGGKSSVRPESGMEKCAGNKRGTSYVIRESRRSQPAAVAASGRAIDRANQGGSRTSQTAAGPGSGKLTGRAAKSEGYYAKTAQNAPAGKPDYAQAHGGTMYKPPANEPQLPYFLWGRSAGAYLCLMAVGKGRLSHPPYGVLSYYGYGFLCDGWFDSPAEEYLDLPRVSEDCLKLASARVSACGDLEHHYSLYIYARQTGLWKSLIYEGRDKYFYADHTLRLCESLSCPLFAVHCMNDPDVPYAEFRAVSDRYRPARTMIVPGNFHDFDRDPDNPYTSLVIKGSISFINKQLV